jgi:transcriptional regulator with XRE-family HTH domain
MSKKPTKAAGNVYCEARYAAAKFNDKLSSREGAAELSGIDRTRLARIELGNLTPYPEEVQLLADLYNAPELENWHCSNGCPIGSSSIPQVEIKELDRIALEIYAAVKDIAGAKDTIMDVALDGVISDGERAPLENALAVLDKVNEKTIALKLYIQKHLDGKGVR